MLKNYKLNPDNWLIVKDCSEKLEIVHRLSGKIKVYNRRSASGEN